MFLSPLVVDAIRAVTPELEDLTLSAILNLFSFKNTIPTVEALGFSTTTATALLSRPNWLQWRRKIQFYQLFSHGSRDT